MGFFGICQRNSMHLINQQQQNNQIGRFAKKFSPWSNETLTVHVAFILTITALINGTRGLPGLYREL